MKIIIGILATALLVSCSHQPKTLEEKEQTLELHYIAWACDCANWATGEDIDKYNDDGDLLAEHSIFIEPADTLLILPDTLGFNNDIVKFTGHFNKRKGFPKNFISDENPDKARVFRYTKYQVIESHHKEYKNDAASLNN